MPDRAAIVFPLVIAENTWTLPYLSIGMITAALREGQKGGELTAYHIEPLRLGGLDGHPLADIYKDIGRATRAVCLFSSYVWNHRMNIQAARDIRAANPHCLIIFGGPEVPKYQGETETFLREHDFIDVAVLGEGELSCAELLLALEKQDRWDLTALPAIDGIVYTAGAEQIRCQTRDRVRNVNELPSPYLTGEFGDWFYEFSNTILETNRGCPYGCTYCDWGSATLQKVTRFSPRRVIAEIEFLASRRARVIFIADANFGMLEQDIEIAEALVEVARRTGYPKKLNANFAKNGGRRVMTVIKTLHEGGLLPTGIIALQTTDAKVLETIRRDNIKTSSYEKMMEYFNAQNIPMATDLMIGLPGQTVASLVKDLQYCFDWKMAASGNYTSMMPNAPMAEAAYRAEHRIVTGEDNLIESTATFSKADMAYMKNINMVYQFHVRLGVLKYLLYFLQLEHGINGLELLQRWLDAVLAKATHLPISGRLWTEVFAMENRTGDWALMSWGDEALFFFQDIEAYYREIFLFVAREFGVELDDSIRATFLQGQSAVMPRMGRSYPFSVELNHDMLGYFQQIKKVASIKQLDGKLKKLRDFPPGTLRVTPKIKYKKAIRFIKISGHTDEWELPSELRFY